MAAFVLVELRVKVPMVEFKLFASRNFVGSNVIALIVTFAMMAQFFFLALYMQNILGYSPLQAGVRFLPATLMIVAIAPLAGRLTDRIGARIPIAVGLSLVSVAMVWLTTIDTATTYGDLLPSFVLMGGGMALVMSPMSTAAMNAVADVKAGIASGILSMNRMIGGTLGVAVIGAVFQAAASSKLDQLLAGSGLSAAQRSDIAHGLGGGQAGTPAGLNHSQAAQAASAAHDAFISAFASSMKVAAAVTIAGVVAAVTLIRSKPREAEPSASAPRTRSRAGNRRARDDLAPSVQRLPLPEVCCLREGSATGQASQPDSPTRTSSRHSLCWSLWGVARRSPSTTSTPTKVDGLNAARLDFERPITVGPNPKFKRVFDQGGLLIRARCGDLSGFFMDVQARTRVDNAEIQAVTTDSSNEQDEAIDRNFDKADSLDVPLGAGSQGEGTLTYSTPSGSHVSLVFQADTGGLSLGSQKACLLGGTALHAPG